MKRVIIFWIALALIVLSGCGTSEQSPASASPQEEIYSSQGTSETEKTSLSEEISEDSITGQWISIYDYKDEFVTAASADANYEKYYALDSFPVEVTLSFSKDGICEMMIRDEDLNTAFDKIQRRFFRQMYEMIDHTPYGYQLYVKNQGYDDMHDWYNNFVVPNMKKACKVTFFTPVTGKYEARDGRLYLSDGKYLAIENRDEYLTYEFSDNALILTGGLGQKAQDLEKYLPMTFYRPGEVSIGFSQIVINIAEHAGEYDSFEACVAEFPELLDEFKRECVNADGDLFEISTSAKGNQLILDYQYIIEKDKTVLGYSQQELVQLTMSQETAKTQNAFVALLKTMCKIPDLEMIWRFQTQEGEVLGEFVFPMELSDQNLADESSPTPSPSIKVGETVFNGMIIFAEVSGEEVSFLCDNKTASGFSFGWSYNPSFEVRTTEGTYTGSIPFQRVDPGQTTDIHCTAENLSGEVLEIAINNVCVLSGGLPAKHGGDTVIIKKGDAADQQVSAGYLSAGVEDSGITFTVDQEAGNQIRLNYANNSGRSFKFGWVDPALAILVTDEGEYYYKLNGENLKEVLPNQEGSVMLFFDEAEGTPKELTISNINLLYNGLPTDFTGSSYTLRF